MPSRFDITSKPLAKAKPCVTQLIRDDGAIEWYEDCKAGQLLRITTGTAKAYINLDQHKIKNFNVSTPEKEVNEAKIMIAQFEEIKDKYDKESEELAKKYQKEIENLEWEKDKEIRVFKNEEARAKFENKRNEKREKRELKAKRRYDDKLIELTRRYVKLSSNKTRNFGTASKPIMGFVCYEKEFNALPNDNVVHDSRQVTFWMDNIMKNFKDFVVQRIEAWGSFLLYGLLGLGVLLFIYFRFVEPKLEKAPEEVQQTVTVIQGLWWMMMFRVRANSMSCQQEQER